MNDGTTRPAPPRPRPSEWPAGGAACKTLRIGGTGHMPWRPPCRKGLGPPARRHPQWGAGAVRSRRKGPGPAGPLAPGPAQRPAGDAPSSCQHAPPQFAARPARPATATATVDGPRGGYRAADAVQRVICAALNEGAGPRGGYRYEVRSLLLPPRSMAAWGGGGKGGCCACTRPVTGRMPSVASCGVI